MAHAVHDTVRVVAEQQRAVWGDRDQVTGEGRPGGTNYVVEVDANGNIIKNWTKWDSLFNTPHQVYISPYDPERAIYIVERGGRQPGPDGVDVHEAVYKFSNDGETLLWKLVDPASKMSGQEQRAMTNLQPTDFGDPSVMTFLPDGRHFLLAPATYLRRGRNGSRRPKELTSIDDGHVIPSLCSGAPARPRRTDASNCPRNIPH